MYDHDIMGRYGRRVRAMIVLFCLVTLVGCASLVERCHEFSEWIDIKAFDCADDKPAPPVDAKE